MWSGEKIWRPAIAVIVLATLLAIAAWQVNAGLYRSRQAVASLCAAEIENLPDARLAEACEQLAAQQQPGWQQLVQFLRHPRAEVAEASATVLVREVERWRALAPEVSSRRVAWLAAALAAELEMLPASRRQLCVGLAEIMLEWPLDSQAVSGSLVVLHCERILRAALADVKIARSDLQQPRGLGAVQPVLPDGGEALPGGGLPVSPVPYDADLPAGTPRLEPTWPRQFQPVPGEAPFQEEGAAAPLATPGEFVPPIAPRVPRPPAPLPLPEHSARALPLGILTDFAVAQALHAEPESRSVAAAGELARRGYSTVHVELARRLCSPSAAERAEACAHLARNEGAHVRPWLYQLARDEDASVRTVAVGLLATSRDAEALDFVQSLRLTERDPGVRAILNAVR